MKTKDFAIPYDLVKNIEYLEPADRGLVYSAIYTYVYTDPDVMTFDELMQKITSGLTAAARAVFEFVRKDMDKAVSRFRRSVQKVKAKSEAAPANAPVIDEVAQAQPDKVEPVKEMPAEEATAKTQECRKENRNPVVPHGINDFCDLGDSFDRYRNKDLYKGLLEFHKSIWFRPLRVTRHYKPALRTG